MKEFAEVIVDLVTDAADRPFHYRVPAAWQGRVEAGSLVEVPFANRRYYGFVTRLLDRPAVAEERVRDIYGAASPLPVATPEQLALSAWLAHRYHCRRVEALRAMIPAGYRRGRLPAPRKVLAAVPGANVATLSNSPARRRALEVILRDGPMSRAELVRRAGVSMSTVRALEKAALVREEICETADRPGPDAASAPAVAPPALTLAQQEVLVALQQALKESRPRKILLHGITGSGKTEVYMRAVDFCLRQGRQALILVPEISLTPQMVERFQGRFPGRLAVIHSRLTPAEKVREWRRIDSGAAPVVLGARSAVFAPVRRLGLIVLDEEHENSYKQEEAPRYHARDVGWWRARRHGAVLLLGSATPSLESFFDSEQDRSLRLELPYRVTAAALPPVEVVDMRREMREGHRHIFSRALQAALKETLEKGEQALLFLNRRGFAGFVLCRECGYVVRCPRCAVSLTLHLDRREMVCHYCSYQAPPPATCPSCGGIYIRHFGAGTQRVEKEVRELFPGVPVIRMDSDTTTGRGVHQRLYRQFKEGRARILVGTQMIAKGLDFPGVTLVGIITADTALNLPDFRAAERTFQLLTQVAGRAGRGEAGGRVILQTYHPQHYSIIAAREHDFISFYREELERRRELAYPPFSDMVRFLFSGEEEAAVQEAAAAFTAQLAAWARGLEVLGPAPAPLARLKTFYRVHTILKGEKLASLAPGIGRLLRAYRSFKPPWPARLVVDFNPQVML